MNYISKVIFTLLLTSLLITPLLNNHISKELSFIIGSILMLGIVFFCKKRTNIQVVDIVCIFLIIVIWINPRFLNDEMYRHVCMILILWSCAKFRVNSYVVYILLLTGLTYVIISFYKTSSFQISSIQWAIDNSGIMGVFLSLIYPLTFGKGIFSCNKWEKRAFLIISVIYVLLVLITGSRSALVAVIVASFFLLYKKGCLTKVVAFSRRKKIVLVAFFVLVVGLMYCLLIYRVDSVRGRMLIYKVTVRMIMDNPLLGYGYNTFAASYLNGQCTFFRENSDSEFVAFADNTVVCFNEPLHIWFEFGVLGELITIGLLFWLFRISGRSKILLLYKASLIALIITSQFSYPLRREESLLVVIVIVGGIFSFDKYTLFKVQRKYLLLLSFPFLIYFYASFIYRVSENNLELNVTSICNHAIEMSKLRQHGTANSCFKKALCYTNSYHIYLMMGRNCENMGHVKMARYYYEYAYSMVPNRFVPLYRLMLLCEIKISKQDALYYAHEIVNKEIKIPSYTVSKIKEEAYKLIYDYENSQK